MSSSGYGSQAVSTTNLTSEDSISIKSISVDETPDLEYRNPVDIKKPEKMDSSLVEETPEEYLGETNSALDNFDISQSSRTEGQLSISDIQNCSPYCKCTNFSILSYIEYTRKDLEETGAYVDTDIDSPISSTKSEGETNKKSTHDQIFDERRKSTMEISQTFNSGDDSPTEGTSVVHTKLPPGKVQ